MRKLTYTNPAGTSIDFFTDPFIIETLDGVGAVETNVQTQKAPYQDGVTFIDALLGERRVEITGAINKPQDFESIYEQRRVMINALNPKLGMGTLTFYYNPPNPSVNDNGIRIIAAIPESSPIFPNKVFTDPFQRFKVTFYCPNPYWENSIEGTESFGILTALTEFPMEFPIEFSSRSGSLSATVINYGDVPAPFTATIYGPAVNPVLTNQTTGEYVKILTTLYSGEYATITTAFGSRIIMINGVNAMQYLDLNSIFWNFAVGSNTISINSDEGFVSARADIVWREKFLGV